MKPEAAAFPDHARSMLERAQRMLSISPFEDAGRTAYMAAFHAAQALIFEREDRVMKTHHGVQSEFHRIARGAPGIDTGIDPNLPAFLSRAHRMKTAADYELGDDMRPSPEEVKTTLDAASAFVVATPTRFQHHQHRKSRPSQKTRRLIFSGTGTGSVARDGLQDVFGRQVGGASAEDRRIISARFLTLLVCHSQMRSLPARPEPKTSVSEG